MDTGGGSTTRAREAASSSLARLVKTVRHRRPGDVHRAVGLLMLALWLTWLVTTIVVQPRFVSESRFEADLRAGQVASWRVVAVDDQDDEPAWADRVWVNIPSADPLGNPDSRGDVPGVVSLAYFTHSSFARMRIVEPGSFPDVLTQQLRDAGIPPAWEVDPRLVDEPSRSSAELPALVLVALFFGALVLGPRPVRGTRSFWFWFAFPTLGLGVVLYTVVEHLRRPRTLSDEVRGRPLDIVDTAPWPDPAATEGSAAEPVAPAPPGGVGTNRRSGLMGWLLSIGLGIVTQMVMATLVTATGWVWLIRP